MMNTELIAMLEKNNIKLIRERDELKARVAELEDILDDGWKKSIEKSIKKNSELRAELDTLRKALEGAKAKLVEADDGGYHLNPYSVDEARDIITASLAPESAAD